MTQTNNTAAMSLPGSSLLARFFAGVFVVLLSIAMVSPVMAQTRQISIGDGQVDEFVIAPGFTLSVETDIQFTEIVVGNSAVADVFPLTETSLYIQGRASGFTNVALYNEANELLGVIDIRVRRDFSELQDEINRAVPGASVSVSNVNDRIRLSGMVENNSDRNRILQLASQYTDSPILNAMSVADAQQVQLDVRILEVERNNTRGVGTNLTGTGSDGITFQTTPGVGVVPFGTAVGQLLEASGTNVDLVINALESKGVARRLANPQLITTSGIQANFVVGGEVPISVTSRDENGNVSSSTGYREYGVRLTFLPRVLGNGLISLEVRPEVSDIDPGLSVNGQPAFISRKAETTVSLRDGQSFAIAGLLQANNSRNVEQVPWLGQIPILGALFKSTEFQKRESDLVILVTPRLVRPASPDEPLMSPLDATRSSNDVELFLLGLLEVDRDMLRAFKEGEGIVGPYGHLIDLEFEDGLLVKK